jgi:hypothetical protein
MAGDACARLVSLASAAIAREACALEVSKEPSVLLALAAAAGSAPEARALVAIAAQTAGTVKESTGAATKGGVGVTHQLLRLCTRHRQGKAAVCVGLNMQPALGSQSPSPLPAALSVSYCARVKAKPLPLQPALELLGLLDCHDWASTGNNRNPTGRKDGIQVRARLRAGGREGMQPRGDAA